MTSAFLGGVTVKQGDGAGTEVFTAIEEVIGLSGFGFTRSQIEATHFASVAREYIPGLADGNEVTILCNHVTDATEGAEQKLLRADCKAGATRNFQILITDGTTPEQYDFAAVCLAWDPQPSVDDRGTQAFTVKITGAVTES